jgi:putative oxidoreductase
LTGLHATKIVSAAPFRAQPSTDPFLSPQGARSAELGFLGTGITGSAMSNLLPNFDLTNEFNILRLICGLFFIPHIYAKFYVPEALGFFVAAKFNPPKAWMYIACVIEIIIVVGLIFAIYPFYAGVVGFVDLVIAAAAVWKVTKGKWLWNIGGYEYCLFWAICCLIVAMHYRAEFTWM